MKFINLLLTLPSLALAAPTSATSPLLARQQSTPILIESVSTVGSGCPSGTWTSTVDGQTVQVSFNAYQVATGPSLPVEKHERNCDITIGFTYPVGCTTAALTNTYHGFAELPAGVSASMTVQQQQSPGNAGPNPLPATIFGGPLWQNGRPWQKTDAVTSRAQFGNTGPRTAAYTVKTRAFTQTNNNQLFGQSTIDELTIKIESQSAC